MLFVSDGQVTLLPARYYESVQNKSSVILFTIMLQLNFFKKSLVPKYAVLAILFFASATAMSAQRIALTTNLLEDVVLAPNVGVEVVVADRQTLSFDLTAAPYKLTEHFYNKCMTVRAGYKFWFDQALYAHHLSVDLLATSTDLAVGEYSFQYECVGAGIGYGYSFILGKRLNLVPSLGIGLAYGRRYEGYDHMSESWEGIQASETSGLMPVITKLSIAIQYVLN